MISNFSIAMAAIFFLIFFYKMTVKFAVVPSWYKHLNVAPRTGEYLYFLGLYSIGIVIVINFVLSVLWVPSKSMEPNYRADSYLLTDPKAFGVINPLTGRHFTSPNVTDLQRGDIVIARFPFSPTVTFLKRVVALPGDEITILKDSIVINDKRYPFTHVQDDIYEIRLGEVSYQVKIDNSEFHEQALYKVPAGHLYLLGDNLNHSSDSRQLGALPISTLLAKPRTLSIL